MRAMDRPRKIGALSLGMALWAAAAPAAATQPLEMFLQKAERQSFDAREARATERQRSADADLALSRLLPALSARGVYTRAQSETAINVPGGNQPVVITPLNQLDAVGQLDVPIVDLANHHRYHSANATAQSASAQREATVIDVSRSVARAYYLFLGASALVRSAESSIAAAQANASLVAERRAAGAATELDHARAVASVARAQQDQADAVLGVSLSARSLETLSGLAPLAAEESFPEDDLHLEGSLEGWLARSSETPAVRAARHQREAAVENRKAAGQSLLPTLAGSAQERVTNASGFAGKYSTYQLQLVLAWRFDYGLLATRDAQSAALDAQLVRVERTERAAADATYEAFRRVEAGIAKSRASRVEEQTAARAAELSAARYEEGVATQLDVTQAQRDAFLAAAARIQSDAELAYARASLRLAVGASLSSVAPPAPEEKP
jgi:outer membrane protein TolC